MTTKILGRFHCATETIEAVHNTHLYRGGYTYAVRFLGGRNHNTVIRCHKLSSMIRLFDEAVAARKANIALWWLGV
jgi:sortase (surface protein transpeptidase)